MHGTKLEFNLKASYRMQLLTSPYDLSVYTLLESGLLAYLMIWLLGWIRVSLNTLYFNALTVFYKSIEMLYFWLPITTLKSQKLEMSGKTGAGYSTCSSTVEAVRVNTI